MSDVTRILNAIGGGDSKAAQDLLPLVYEELRKLAAHKMANEAPGQTLQPTALVHEAWLRLVGTENPQFEGCGHFFAAAAEAMRRILIEAARHKGRERHGGGRERVDLDGLQIAVDSTGATACDVLALDEVLIRLEAADPVKAQLVKLRFYTGLTLEEAASLLDLSPATADRYWAFAKAWLYRELTAR